MTTNDDVAGRDRPAPDRGAALVVAIGFVVMIGMIGAGLTSMITSGVGNRAQLEEVRDRQYAADGAIETEIAAMVNELPDGSVACGDTRSSTVIANGLAIRVEAFVTCGAVRGDSGAPEVQRSTVFTACVDPGGPCPAADVMVRALVGFEQASNGAVLHTSVHSWSVLR